MGILKFLKRGVRTIIALKQLLSTKSLIQGECYFPEIGERKSKFRVLFDQIKHILKYSYCNHFYFLYGFDIKGFRNQDDYVDYSVFMRRRNYLNFQSPASPIAVLRDKTLFDRVSRVYGFSIPRSIGFITRSKDVFLFDSYSYMSLSEVFKDLTADIFLKVVDGECANGIYHVVCRDGIVKYHNSEYTPEEFSNILPPNCKFLIQEKLPEQHPQISALFNKAINTIRLVTILPPPYTTPVVFSAVLRVGVGENEVDNWAAGGLSIGIDLNDKCLREYGYYKPGFGTKVSKHPDSGITFKGYKIPYLEEAIKQALAFHSILDGIHSIGWDIAITKDGPFFIEGNDNWEISLMQISNEGLKRKFNELFY